MPRDYDILCSLSFEDIVKICAETMKNKREVSFIFNEEVDADLRIQSTIFNMVLNTDNQMEN